MSILLASIFVNSHMRAIAVFGTEFLCQLHFRVAKIVMVHVATDKADNDGRIGRNSGRGRLGAISRVCGTAKDGAKDRNKDRQPCLA